MIGDYLVDNPRAILYKLAKSKDLWERRTAIVSTWAFIKKGDVGDAFKLADMLANDPHEFVQKAVASWVREAGKRDPKKLKQFLDKHATSLPRATLRTAIEKLDAKTKKYYMELKDK